MSCRYFQIPPLRSELDLGNSFLSLKTLLRLKLSTFRGKKHEIPPRETASAFFVCFLLEAVEGRGKEKKVEQFRCSGKDKNKNRSQASTGEIFFFLWQSISHIFRCYL